MGGGAGGLHHAGAQSGSHLQAEEAARAGVWRPEAGSPVSGTDDERSPKLGYGPAERKGGGPVCTRTRGPGRRLLQELEGQMEWTLRVRVYVRERVSVSVCV